MIKLFRKIRQAHFFKNRLGKYSLYAIGEILLVVIGILIALRINNWNELQKIRATEKVYLEALYEELLRDSSYYELTDSYLTTIEESGRRVIAILDDPKKSITDSLRFLNDIRSMIGLDQKLPEPIIWQELQSSGNLRLIDNRNLIEMLYQHYQLVASCQKDYDNNAHHFILRGRYLDSKIFSLEDQDDYFDNWEKNRVSQPEVFKELLHNREFYAIAKGITTGMLISRKRLALVISSVNKPIEELRMELKKKS